MIRNARAHMHTCTHARMLQLHTSIKLVGRNLLTFVRQLGASGSAFLIKKKRSTYYYHMYDVLPLLVVLFQLDKPPRHNHPDATYACQHPHNPEEGKAKHAAKW